MVLVVVIVLILQISFMFFQINQEFSTLILNTDSLKLASVVLQLALQTHQLQTVLISNVFAIMDIKFLIQLV